MGREGRRGRAYEQGPQAQISPEAHMRYLMSLHCDCEHARVTLGLDSNIDLELLRRARS